MVDFKKIYEKRRQRLLKKYEKEVAPKGEKKPSKKKKSKKEEAPVEILSLDELNK